MALYIRAGPPGIVLLHHCGDNKSILAKLRDNKLAVEQVISVTADGDELDIIRSQSSFSNLPLTTKRVVYWFGDHAKFIAANF